MKKLVLLFTSALLLSAQPALAYDFSAVAPTGQTLYYNIVDGHAEVVRPMGGSHYNDYVSGDLVVPATVIYNGTTYDVTALASLPSILQSWGTFYGCSTLTSVTLPSSIVSIGEYAFYQCSNLISVNIPNGVSSIGNRTFYECSNLTSISLPNSVTSIGEYAFSGCSSLTSINITNDNKVTL